MRHLISGHRTREEREVMGDAYRIATKVPWEDDPRDWSGKFNTVEGVLHELRDRAEHHRGKQFDERVKGKGQFGNDRPLVLTIDAARHDLVGGQFGDCIIVRSHDDNVEWWTRKIKDKDPVINLSEANKNIDWIYQYVFSTHHDRYPGVQNWGTCNRRFIDGTTEWSEHSPWYPGNQSGSGGCNAIDFNASHDVMYELSRDLSQEQQHVAKILFYRMEWTPQTGWINAPSIGTSHDGHVHVEGPRIHGGLAPACNY
jgi:hypothetical protein